MESQDQKYQSCAQTKRKSDSAMQLSIYESLSDAINSIDLPEPGSIICTTLEEPHIHYMTADGSFVPMLTPTQASICQDTHTLKNMPECPSCGARSYVKTNDGYRCEYCGNLVCI